MWSMQTPRYVSSVVLGQGSGPSPTQARAAEPDPGSTLSWTSRAQVGLRFWPTRDPGLGRYRYPYPI
jgi:hypothetical protein